MEETVRKKERNIIFSLTFLFTLTTGLTMYTNSSFLEELFGAQETGLLYAIAAAIAIVLITRATHTIRQIGNKAFFLRFATIHGLSLLALSLQTLTPLITLLAFVGYFASGYILVFSLDVFFQNIVQGSGKGLSRGVFLLLNHIGLALAPFVALTIVAKGGYSGTYLLSFILFFIIALVVVFALRKYHDVAYTEERLRTTFEHLRREPTLAMVILANFLLNFFYVWIVIYTPLYLIGHLGFSWGDLSILFSIVLLPFIFLTYPLGALAEKLGSEKELAAIGFLIAAVALFLLGYFDNPSIYLVGLLLVLTRVGASAIEAMTEIHFFKITKAEDTGTLSVFRDLRPLSYVVAPILGTLVLFFFPIKMIFVFLGLLMVVGFLIAGRLEVNHKWWKRSH